MFGKQIKYHTKNGGKGKTLAKNILAEMEKIGQNSRGAKTRLNASGNDYFGFIRQTKMPAVLVECAFVDNKADVKIIDTATEQKKMGEAIAKGVLKTLGIADKVIEEETTATDKIYRVQVGAFKNKENAQAMQKKLKKAGFDSVIV